MEIIEQFALLLECKNEAAWQRSVFHLGKDYGFEQTLLAVVPDRETTLDKAFLRSNYSSCWRSTYDANHLVNIDPTVAHCLTRSIPLIWEPDVFASRLQKEMYEEACIHGLRSGITLPFHGANEEVGILCFVNDIKPSKQFQREALNSMPALSMMRDFAFEASLRFAKPKTHGRPPAITCRELECLKWSTSGKSSWDIAQILHCSEAAVNFHFSNLRRKFNVTTRRQAIVRAIHYGLIQPN